MDFEDDTEDTSDSPVVSETKEDEASPAQVQALIRTITRKIKDDKAHHKKAFDRMRANMQVAMHGADKDWISGNNYKANISGRHVRQKVAALYAKNPKTAARRRDTLDFAVWDENPQSLLLAYQTIQMAQQAVAMAQQAPPNADPLTGLIVPQAPQMPPGFEQAMATIQDFQQGMERRKFATRYGETLQRLFEYSMREQKPLDFKRGMKQVVRRTCTCGVGYVELGFQREYGPRPGMEEKLADARTRLDHLRRLSEEMAEGEIDEDSAERAELEASIQSLQNEPETILREGLIVDYPSSTKVIPDKQTKMLEGFVGARHLTIEYMFTPDEIKEMFGVDINDGYTPYNTVAGSTRDVAANDVLDDDYEWTDPQAKRKEGMVCVWKHYDKPSGLVYYIADGCNKWLREPAPPDVFVEEFWPIYALTFNAVESEDELFPPSDVELMIDMQKEYNRSRQGLREHRMAARPRWVYANGTFEEDETDALKDLKPFEAMALNIAQDARIGDILQPVPIPGVDPNLYETGPIFTDTQLVVGAQESQFGGVSKATATESAIAANSSASADGSNIDDLDGYLTVIARAGGQILQREMSAEKVMEIVGPGAVWPEMSLPEIASEIYLDVEAGSTGKPNQAVEVNNWKSLLPMLLQIPSIDPTWLARETLRRLDDRLDLTEAISAGLPSIVSMNSQKQIAGPVGPQGDAQASDPNQQGSEGANNAPQPPGGDGGSSAAFGSNQVASPV